MFHAENLTHTGVYDTAGVRNLKGVKWAFQTGGPVLTSPAIAGSAAYIGSDDRRVYAVDLATGKQLWMFATGGPVRSSPAMVEGTVYFGRYSGLFYALDAGTGLTPTSARGRSSSRSSQVDASIPDLERTAPR